MESEEVEGSDSDVIVEAKLPRDYFPEQSFQHKKHCMVVYSIQKSSKIHMANISLLR